MLHYISCRIISLCPIVFYYTDTVFQKKRKVEIKTSVVSSVLEKMTNCSVAGDLRKAWVVGGGVSLPRPRGARGARTASPASQGGPSFLTGARPLAGDEPSLRRAEWPH